MTALPLLFAAAGIDVATFIKIALVAIFIIGSLIKALSNAVKAANQKAKSQLPDLRNMPDEPSSAEATLEEFLARVNRQRAESKRNQTRSEPMYMAAEVVDAEVVPPESVAQHVARHIPNLSNRQLPHERMASDDLAREANLTRKFTHQMGRLTTTSGPANASAPEPAAPDLGIPNNEPAIPAADLFQLLRSPLGLRQAVILNEILTRPDFDKLS